MMSEIKETLQSLQHRQCSKGLAKIHGMTMLQPAGLTAVMGMTGGLKTQLAFIHDFLCILAMPLMLAYIACAKLHALQLHYTLLMWRLMRGHRCTDSLQSVRATAAHHSGAD